jgi:hypothetical protein
MVKVRYPFPLHNRSNVPAINALNASFQLLWQIPGALEMMGQVEGLYSDAYAQMMPHYENPKDGRANYTGFDGVTLCTDTPNYMDPRAALRAHLHWLTQTQNCKEFCNCTFQVQTAISSGKREYISDRVECISDLLTETKDSCRCASKKFVCLVRDAEHNSEINFKLKYKGHETVVRRPLRLHAIVFQSKSNHWVCTISSTLEFHWLVCDDAKIVTVAEAVMRRDAKQGSIFMYEIMAN